MKIYSIFIHIIFLGLFINFIPSVSAAIYINEIFPAPSTSTMSAEWVELYNDADEDISIAGFTLKDASNNTIPLTNTIIPAKGFISATSNNILNNSGDTITLKNTKNDVVDYVLFTTIPTNQSFARCPDGSSLWHIILNASKNLSNNSTCPFITTTPSITPTASPTILVTPTTFISPSSTPSPTPGDTINEIYLSEVMVYPSANEKEWVEIFNNNNFIVTLENWFIDDKEHEGSSPRSFSLSIPAKSYGVIELSSGIFNNDGDSVRLLNTQQVEQESFTYDHSEQGKTWGKVIIEDLELCLQESTKNTANTSCFVPSLTPTKSPTPTKFTTPTKIPTPKVAATTKKISTVNSNSNTSEQNITNESVQKTILQPTKNKIFTTRIPIKDTKSVSKNSISLSNKKILRTQDKKEMYNYSDERTSKNPFSIFFAAISYAGIAMTSIALKVKDTFIMPFRI